MNETLVNQTTALTASGLFNQILDFFEKGGTFHGNYPLSLGCRYCYMSRKIRQTQKARCKWCFFHE